MKKSLVGKVAFLGILLAAGSAAVVYPHCQIPCGIYGDPARFELIAEHITTIEKSMKQINELSEQDKPNYNQLVRWVENKDRHADEIAHIVAYYFMAQRIKPVEQGDTQAYNNYVARLTMLHHMLVYGMKAKQTTDPGNVEKLRSLLAEFRAAYFEQAEHKH